MTRGPWPLAVWNDFAEVEFACARRKSYAALADELEGEAPRMHRQARRGRARKDLFRDFERMTFDEVDAALDATLRSAASGAAPAAKSGGRANARAESASAALHENELFVLQMAGLAWPVSLGQAKAAYHDAVMLLHPDRHPGHSATAHEKMTRINDGWRRLKLRLVG